MLLLEHRAGERLGRGCTVNGSQSWGVSPNRFCLPVYPRTQHCTATHPTLDPDQHGERVLDLETGRPGLALVLLHTSSVPSCPSRPSLGLWFPCQPNGLRREPASSGRVRDPGARCPARFCTWTRAARITSTLNAVQDFSVSLQLSIRTHFQSSWLRTPFPRKCWSFRAKSQ